MNFKICPPRCLRTTWQVANVEHRCSNCPHPIDLGEYYKREVWLTVHPDLEPTPRVIAIYKEHEMCPGDRYEDEEEKDCNHSSEEEPAFVPIAA